MTLQEAFGDRYNKQISEKDAMRLAYDLAAMSPDPSTQNGAVLISRHGYCIGLGYNRFPDGVTYNQERWEKPAKYHLVWHAEESAIYNAIQEGFDTDRSTLVCPWAACSECAKTIVGLGVKRLVRLNNSAPSSTWDDSIKYGDLIMKECGVEIVDVDWEFADRPKVRRGGVLI